MAKRKEQPPEFVWDATGLSVSPLSVSEVLTQGSPAEVREALQVMGSLLLAGLPLSQAEARWLGGALVAIGHRAPADVQLRVAADGPGRARVIGPVPWSLRLWRAVGAMHQSLLEQGASNARACDWIISLLEYEKRGKQLDELPQIVQDAAVPNAIRMSATLRKKLGIIERELSQASATQAHKDEPSRPLGANKGRSKCETNTGPRTRSQTDKRRKPPKSPPSTC